MHLFTKDIPLQKLSGTVDLQKGVVNYPGTIREAERAFNWVHVW